MDSSVRTGANVIILSSLNLRESLICAVVAVKSAVVVRAEGADTSMNGGNFTIFKSKIGMSNSSLSAGSTFCTEVGQSRSSSAVSMCTEAVVGNGYVYTRAGNENRF
uniref:Uncharacterized protein n=1 Tax=Romanomermis culicivorax TaxID=13658 RepID=A0A915IDN6_ROMCU